MNTNDVCFGKNEIFFDVHETNFVLTHTISV